MEANAATNDPGVQARYVTDINNQYYNWNGWFLGQVISEIADDPYSPPVNFDITDAWPGYQGAWLFDDISRTYRYLKAVRAEEPGGINIHWQLNVNSTGLCSTSCFLPIAPPYGVFIRDQDKNAPDAVVHELGHAYRYGSMGAWFFATADQYLACLQHTMFQAYNPACGWSEGFPDFFALAVNAQLSPPDADVCFDYVGPGPCEAGSANLEAQYPGDGRGAYGDQVEGRVAGALWDILDNPNDGASPRTSSCRTRPALQPTSACRSITEARLSTAPPAPSQPTGM